MDRQQLPDFNQIMQLAQKVATQIEPPAALRSGKQLSPADMTNVIGQITKSVSDVMTPEMMSAVSGAGNSSGGSSSKKRGKQKTKEVTPNLESVNESKISFDVTDNKSEVKDLNCEEIAPPSNSHQFV